MKSHIPTTTNNYSKINSYKDQKYNYDYMLNNWDSKLNDKITT